MQEERKKSEEDPDHHGHLDHSNPHTFEVQDLQMLMNKVRKDLEEVDESRRKEFKEYEMQKEFEKEQKMKEMDEEHKKQYLKELEEEKKAAQHHDPVRPVHHPGSQAQLEEVWEKSDHMSQKFDPKAFFYLHDLDGNGYWDEQEVNALFIKELDKIYAQQPNNHVDMREREEEMERMREHVFKETDTNRDRFISFTEFLEQTKRDEWRRDEGWESIDQKPQFTQKEYEEFEKQRQMEIQRLIEQGVKYIPMLYLKYHPAQGAGVPINQAQYGMPQYQAHPGAQQQYQAHPAAHQQGQAQAQYQSHPAAGQPQYQAHPPVQQQQYQGHPAQQQYQPHPAAGQPPYQAHPAAQQQYQAHPAAQQQYQAHPAAQQQFHPNQVPQYQQPPVGQQPPQQQQQYQPPQNQGPPHPPASQTNQIPPAANQAPPKGQQAPPQGQLAPPQGQQAPPQGQQAPLQSNQPSQPPSNALPAPAQPQGQPQQTNQVPAQQYNVPDPSKNNEIPHGNY
uniref:Nucleobindin-1 n=1 Tax=Lygus hesperus TaxID=30085 RepID=A0A0A9YPC7_LYGHE